MAEKYIRPLSTPEMAHARGRHGDPILSEVRPVPGAVVARPLIHQRVLSIRGVRTSTDGGVTGHALAAPSPPRRHGWAGTA